MRCVTSVSYQLLINGSPTKAFTPTRGIRQGDPLSPLFFTICSEELLALLNKAANHNDIHGIQMGKEGPILTHLLFADDSLIFLKATLEEVATLKGILHTYELAFGQSSITRSLVC